MRLNAESLVTARSWLFVPGDRPDRFQKAADSGADAIILDLEDAVAAARKERAREAVRAWVAAGGAGVVRVNPATSTGLEADLTALAGHDCVLMLPKAESRDQVDRVRVRHGGAGVIPLIETARGVLNVAEIAASSGVVRLAFGNGDLGAQLGVGLDDHLALQAARSQVVIASTAAGLPQPIDGVTVALDDLETLRDDTRHAKRLGFGGRACIHPRHVEEINAVFAPTDAEIAWARAVVTADDGVSTVDGQMVDGPVIARARSILGLVRE